MQLYICLFFCNLFQFDCGTNHFAESMHIKLEAVLGTK